MNFMEGFLTASTGLGASLLIFIFSIIIVVAFIRTLIIQLSNEEHAWFVITLLFPFMFLIYWLIRLLTGKRRKKK